MSSPRYLRSIVVASALFGSVGAAQAEVQCPIISGGHVLAKSGGGRLFDGPISDNAFLAPDRQASGSNDYNLYSIPNPSRLTLVCAYTGGIPLAMKLTSDIHQCSQNVKTGGFRCN